MAYAFYVAVKLIAYAAWCWYGLRLWRPTSSTLSRAMLFGTARLAIGIGFGLMIFTFVSDWTRESAWEVHRDLRAGAAAGVVHPGFDHRQPGRKANLGWRDFVVSGWNRGFIPCGLRFS